MDANFDFVTPHFAYGSIAAQEGYSHIKTYRELPKWEAFLQGVPRHGSHFHKKFPSYGMGPFSKFSQVFEVNP